MSHRIIKEQKKEKVNNLSNFFQEKKGVALFENKGINSNEINLIRKKARMEKIQIVIEKNTLWKIALKNIIQQPEIKGKTVAFIADNAMDALGFSQQFTKEESKLLIPVAMIDENGGIFDKKKVENFSKLRNKQELLASLLITMKMPVIKLIKVLDLASKK